MAEFDVLECFRVRESGNIYCYVVDENYGLAVVKPSLPVNYDYEVSFNDLPESVKECIKKIEGEIH